MMLMAHLKDEAEPSHTSLTLKHLSSDVRQKAKHTMIGILQLHADVQELQNYEICPDTSFFYITLQVLR